MVTGAVGGGGLSTLASAGMKAAGLPNIGRLTTANVVGGLLEGTVQGIGDRPDDPLKGGAWGGAFGTGGALVGEGLSALSRARLEKAARAGLKGQYDPSAIAVDDITLNDRLMPEGATGEVIQLPKLDFDGAKDPSFDSGPFNVDEPKSFSGWRYDSDLEGLSTEKPTGLYFSLESNDFYKRQGFGDIQTEAIIKPLNPLELMVDTDMSSGTATLNHLLGEDSTIDITSDIPHLKSLVQSKYPNLDYSRVRDEFDYINIYAAQLAKENGYDAIILRVKDNPQFDEIVALKPDIVKMNSKEFGIEFVDPSVSLSGHSSLDTASTEAINRMKAGVSFFGMDPGGGIYPLANTVDAIDAPIRPGHVKIQMNADGSKSVVSGRPNATQTRSISDGDFTIKEEAPELVGELELDLDGPSVVWKTDSHGNKYPDVTMDIGGNKSEPQKFYRETNFNSLRDLIGVYSSDPYADAHNTLFVSNNKDLALGQGNNKGVLVEFDDISDLRGSQNHLGQPQLVSKTKPGDLSELDSSHGSEYVFRDKPNKLFDRITKITIDSTKTPVSKSMLGYYDNILSQSGFTKTVDGPIITYEKSVPRSEFKLDLDGPSVVWKTDSHGNKYPDVTMDMGGKNIPPGSEIPISPEIDDQIESITRQFEEKMRGPKTEKAVAESVGEVEGTLTWFDNLISTLKSLKADQPNQPRSRVMKESGKWSGKRLPVRHLSTLETIIRKVQGQLIKQGSIGGLKRNVSLAAAAAEQTTEEGQKFVKFFTDLLWNQKADAEAMIGKGNNLIISIQEKMMQVAKDSGIPYSQINESLRRAHIRNDYSEIPDEELKGLAQQFGKFLWEDGGKILAAHHNDPKIAKGIIYRGINYLHDSYLGLKVEPEKWLNNRAIEDPESFKKVMSWATRKLIEAGNVPKNPDGSTNFALLEENATGLVTQLLLKSREGTASVPLRGATSSIDFDPLKTTQGEIETRFTDLLDSTAEKMRLEAEGLGEGAVYTRPKIDSIFEPFLENVPEESARRIRNTYTKLVLDKAGIELPPGEKVDYQVVRNLIDEETSERLFREAIREEDMPEYLRKFLGGRSGFIESAQESLGKIAHNVSVISMYKQMTDAGLEAGVLSPVPGPGWVQVSSPSKLGFGAGFGDIYAPPQLAKVMNDSIDAADKIGLVNRLYNTMKLGKILTVPSMMRNVVSGVWDSVANGEFLNPKWWESMGTSRAAAVKGILNGNDQMTKAALANPAMRDAIYKTFRVEKYLNDPSFAPVFIDLVKKNFFQGGSEREVQVLADIVARQEAGQGDFSGQILQEMAGVFARIYQSPDEFFKINAYFTRLSELKWAEGSSPTLDKLDEIAAEMVKDTYQHYDYTPPIARSLSKLPLGPTFITFPIEKLRNTKNLVTETVWYLERAANAAVKEGDLGKSLRYTTLGTKKMAGMAAGLYMAYEAAKETNEFLFGMDDEKQAALSEIVQFRGSKGSPIIYLDYDPQKHTAEFIDFSGANPFPHVAASIRILDDTGKDWDQKLEEIKDELSQIYTPTGIFTKAIAEAATGRSVRSVTDIGNSPRYDTNPDAPGGSMWPPFGDASPTTKQEQAGRTLYRFYRNTAPGVLTQGEALGRAATGSEFGSRKFSLAGEAMYYSTGLRPTQVDLTTGMKFAVRENKDQLSDLRQSWVNGARGIPEGDIKSFAELRKTKQAELDRLMKDARYFSSVAQRIDFSYEDIDRMFEASDSRVYTKKIREAILDGYDIGIEDLWNYE